MSPASGVPSHTSERGRDEAKWLRKNDSPPSRRLRPPRNDPEFFFWVVVVMARSPLMQIMAPASAVIDSPASSVTLAAVLPERCSRSMFMARSPELRVEPAGQAGQAARLDHHLAASHHARDQALAAEE